MLSRAVQKRLSLHVRRHTEEPFAKSRPAGSELCEQGIAQSTAEGQPLSVHFVAESLAAYSDSLPSLLQPPNLRWMAMARKGRAPSSLKIQPKTTVKYTCVVTTLGTLLVPACKLHAHLFHIRMPFCLSLRLSLRPDSTRGTRTNAYRVGDRSNSSRGARRAFAIELGSKNLLSGDLPVREASSWAMHLTPFQPKWGLRLHHKKNRLLKKTGAYIVPFQPYITQF